MLLGAGRDFGLGGQASLPQPHAPLTFQQRQERAAYFASKRGLQFGVPDNAYQRALGDAGAMASVPAVTPTGTFAWNTIGPLPMLNNHPNFGGVFTGPPLTTSAGRVSAVAADPTTKNLVYVGAAGGGVWRSTDGGATFTQVFQNEPVQAIGAITVDRTGKVWVGTGEGVHSDSYYGQGIFVSSDQGKTWAQITGGTSSPFVHTSFRRIAVDGNNPPHIFAAATFAASLSRADATFIQTDLNNVGLWRSTDGGATWAQVGNSVSTGGFPTFNTCTLGATGPCPATDVVVDPANSNSVFAASEFVNVFHSTDGGTTWAEAQFPGIATGTVNQIGRAAVALATGGLGKPATVYASLGRSGGQFFRGVFLSTDSGVTWQKRAIPSVVVGTGSNTTTLDGDGTGVGPFSQSGYDQTLTVLPSKPSTVFFGGVGPYISNDAGATWAFIGGSTTNTTVQETHSDQQASVLDPFTPSRLYIGNDGGFYAYDLATNSWTTFFNNNQNATISSGQIQAIGPHPTDSTKVLAGFQDNGTQLFTGSLGWNTVETGDGGFALFDALNPNFAYHTFASVNGSPAPSRSTDGGLSWDSLDPFNGLTAVSGNDAFNFYPPLAADPGSGSRVMIGGHFIYVSTDGMITWQTQSNNLAGACNVTNGICALQDIEFVPNTTMAWALSIQENNVGFTLSNTTQANLNAGVTWTDVTANLPFNTAQTQATGITADPNSGQSGVAYLSVSGFTAATGIGHIFRTANFGKTWTRADGAGGSSPLPDVPTLRVLVDSTDSTGNTILAGTDIGVFRSTDAGATWATFNLGVIPSVPIFDLEQNKNGVIFAATHGRGAYKLAVGTGATPTPAMTTTATPGPTPTALPGAMVSSSSVTGTGLPGATVAAGSLTVTNTTGGAETVSGIDVTVSNPGIFASLTLTGSGQTVTVSPASATTHFALSPGVTLAAGGSLTFSLSGMISAHPVMRDSGIKYAGLVMAGGWGSIGRADLPATAGLLLMGLALTSVPAARRRRIVLGAGLVIALAATQLGCGGSSNNTTLITSSQAVSAITITNSTGGPVGVSGLPAALSVIRAL